MFDRDSLKRLAYSNMMALLITLFALAFSAWSFQTLLILIKGIFAGTVIWLLGEFLFSLFESIFPKSILPGYCALVILVVTGTAGFSLIFGVRDIKLLIIICILSLSFALGITVYSRRRYIRRLNRHLTESKNKF